jgi:hypothetical protein
MLVMTEPWQGLIKLTLKRRILLRKLNNCTKMYRSALMRWSKSKILLRKISKLKLPNLTPRWILKTPLRESMLTTSVMMLTLM